MSDELCLALEEGILNGNKEGLWLALRGIVAGNDWGCRFWGYSDCKWGDILTGNKGGLWLTLGQTIRGYWLHLGAVADPRGH